jgi:hypothetical protein
MSAPAETTVGMTAPAVAAMTEPSGRAARWTAAALAAPVVAGVFAGTTTWATRADPLHSGSTNGGPRAASGSPSAASSAVTDPTLEVLRQQLAAEQRTMNQLAGKVAAVRARATALGRATGSGGAGGTAARGSGNSAGAASAAARPTGSNHSDTTSGGRGAAAPAAPSPPPPTHGNTGASGTG